MNLNERLRNYNGFVSWRRGEVNAEVPNPTQLGNDIDEAIAKLAAAEKLAEDLRIARDKYDKTWQEEDIPTSRLVLDIKDALTAYQSQTKETT